MPTSPATTARSTRRWISGAGVLAAFAGVCLVVPATSADAAPACTDVQVVFARGTTEAPGLGTVGSPFVSSLTRDVSGKSVSSYAVNYAAAIDQSSAGAGSTDLTNHVVATAASCPSTKFVLGGYSQGASVVDKSLGVQVSAGGGTGTVLPASVSGKVAAVVVFGNPLGLQRKTIETASPTYGTRAKSYCNTGDPVCGNGFNAAAHLQYASNGSTTQGALVAAGKLN